MKARGRALAAALSCAFAAAAAGGKGAPAAKRAAARDKASAAQARQKEVLDDLARERAATAQLARRESGLLNRLAEFERQIEVEGGALRAAQARLHAADARLQASEARARAADAQIARATQRLTPRLVARYRLGREHYVRFLLGARSVADVLRRRRLLTAVVERDLDALDDLRERADRAKAARDELARARAELAVSTATERQRRAALDQRLGQQKAALAEIQHEKGAHEQAARELEEAGRALSRTLAELQEHPPPRKPPEALAANSQAAAAPTGDAPAQPAGPSAAAPSAPAGAPPAGPAPTAAVQAAAAVPAPPAAPADPSAAAASPAAPAGASASAPAAAPSSRAAAQVASAPPAAQVASAAPDPAKAAARRALSLRPPVPEPAIRTARGRLLFPVPGGEIEARFGRSKDPRFGTVTLQRGIDVRAPAGSLVRAVHGGTVVHAGWFRGYGNLMIVDHGGGMFSLMAHLATLDRAVGDVVHRGDRLGTVGETGSLKGSYLYFELRDGQTPLDPEPWLGKPRPAVRKG